MGESKLYFDNHKNNKVILVDFDNTICVDEWPYIGTSIPYAIDVLKKLKNAGHTLILYTQRSYQFPVCNNTLEQYRIKYPSYDTSEIHWEHKTLEPYTIPYVDILTPVIKYCKEQGIEFDDINGNKEWETITGDNSRKVFNDFVIDDHNLGIEINEVINSQGEVCKVVNWESIDKHCKQIGLY